jgi:hypothetical protein
VKAIDNSPDIAPPLPANVDAERSALAAALLDSDALKLIVERLRSEDFFLAQHRRIFAGIIRLRDAGVGVDLVTVVDDLERNGGLEAAGGAAYVSQLGDSQPVIGHTEYYARIVKEKSVLRNLAFSAAAIQEQALAGNGDAATILSRARATLSAVSEVGTADDWRSVFDSYEQIVNAKPLHMAIEGIAPLDSAMAIGALSGHGKTWTMGSIGKAMLKGKGTRLWGEFEVLEDISRIVYLIPESTCAPFAHRLRLLGLFPFVKNERLLVRTLSMGPRPSLSDPRILAAAKGSYIFLDTLVRFVDGDENSSAEFQVLANEIFALLSAGAVGVAVAHHAPKNFAQASSMSLEAVLRGSSDIGAIFGSVLAMKQIDADRNILHLECVKARDHERPGAFQIIGRPFIDDSGDFQMYCRPGECGRLEDYFQPRDRGGAPEAKRQAKNANKELMRRWLRDEPSLNSTALSQRFRGLGIKLGDSAIRKYRSEL